MKSVLVSLCDIYEHLFWQHAWMWLLWLLSQAWISQYIWKPKVGRLMSTEVLFCTPMYDSMFVDQSLAFNRRHDKDKELLTEVKIKVYCICLHSEERILRKASRRAHQFFTF